MLNVDQKLEPGVYKVIKSFKYCNIPIEKGETLHVSISGDSRVKGGLWYGFKRDSEECEWYNASFFERAFMREPKNYNSKFIPLDSVEKVDTNK